MKAIEIAGTKKQQILVSFRKGVAFYCNFKPLPVFIFAATGT
jgi:hypothetical protein